MADNPLKRIAGVLLGVVFLAAVRDCGADWGHQRAKEELCGKRTAAAQSLVQAWDRLEAASAKGRPVIQAAVLEAEARGGWPDLTDLLAAAGVDSAAYERAFDGNRAALAEAAGHDAVLRNDAAAAHQANADMEAVILDALQTAGGRGARERGAAILEGAKTVAMRTTFADPEAECLRKAENEARAAYVNALDNALTAHYESRHLNCGCDSWHRAASAIESAGEHVNAFRLRHAMVAAARNCSAPKPPRPGRRRH